MLADIIADAGYGVLNLGPDTPTASLVAAMRDAGSLAAVVVSVVDIERRTAAGSLLAAARRERPSVPAWSVETRSPTSASLCPLARTGGGRGSARARRPDRSAASTGVMIPPPVAGVRSISRPRPAGSPPTVWARSDGPAPAQLQRRGAAIELGTLATRLAEHRRVVLVDWLGFGTSDRPDAPYGWALYGEQLERIGWTPSSRARPRSMSSRSRFRGQYVRRLRRGASGAIRPHRPHQSDRFRPLQGSAGATSRNLPVSSA